MASKSITIRWIRTGFQPGEKIMFRSNYRQFFANIKIKIVKLITVLLARGPQKISSPKSLQIQNPPTIPGIFNPANIIPYQILGGKTVKNDQRDPQTAEI